jgi:secreted trypsin-like serine protease
MALIKSFIVKTGKDMRQLFITLTLLSIAACAPKSSDMPANLKNSSVINGTLVKEADVIAMSTVAIYNTKDMYLCTGTIIGENIVLTAAHCAPEKPSQLKIVFSTDMDDTLNSREPDVLAERVLPVTDFKAHSKWDPNNETVQFNTFDIALIKFKGSLPKGFVAASIIKDDSTLKKGDVITVAGFGVSFVDTTKEINPKKYPHIQEAIEAGQVICDEDSKGNPINCFKVEMEGEGILRTTEAPISMVIETEFHLNETKAGTCSGDSGGPAYVKNGNELLLVGVTSRGSALCNEVGVYTRAQTFKTWIDETIKTLK